MHSQLYEPRCIIYLKTFQLVNLVATDILLIPLALNLLTGFLNYVDSYLSDSNHLQISPLLIVKL